MFVATPLPVKYAPRSRISVSSAVATPTPKTAVPVSRDDHVRHITYLQFVALIKPINHFKRVLYNSLKDSSK